MAVDDAPPPDGPLLDELFSGGGYDADSDTFADWSPDDGASVGNVDLLVNLWGMTVAALAGPDPAGDAIEWNQFCPTGEGGGVDPSCGVGGKGGEAGREKEVRRGTAPTPAPPGVAVTQLPAPLVIGNGGPMAPAEEHATSKALAEKKIKDAPVPNAKAVEKARAEMEKARAGVGRPGGDSRGGSSADRRKQRQNLFKEFGGEEKGYIVCPWTGIKMHWSDDPKDNPHGYPRFERGKIFTKVQGGGYQLPNLLPESFAANRSRNDATVRPENLA